MENEVLEIIGKVNLNNIEERNLLVNELTDFFGFEFKEVDAENNFFTYHGYNSTTKKMTVITVNQI